MGRSPSKPVSILQSLVTTAILVVELVTTATLVVEL